MRYLLENDRSSSDRRSDTKKKISRKDQSVSRERIRKRFGASFFAPLLFFSTSSQLFVLFSPPRSRRLRKTRAHFRGKLYELMPRRKSKWTLLLPVLPSLGADHLRPGVSQTPGLFSKGSKIIAFCFIGWSVAILQPLNTGVVTGN